MEVYEKINEYITEGKKGAIATIIKKLGAAPRESGAKMFIGEDGRIFGSIGGGCMEADVYEEAKVVMKTGAPKILNFRLNASTVEEEGMLCGGNIDVLLEPLLERHKEIYKRIVDKKENLIILRKIGENLFLKSLIAADGTIFGDPLEKDQKVEEFFNLKEICIFEDGTIVEPLLFKPHLFIFGAGHVSFFLSKIASIVNFDHTVIDDRPEFASKERFPDAEVIVESFENVFDRIKISKNDYIVIVTRGHKYDAYVLEKVLKERPTYVGMIGSRRKVKAVFDYLLSKGFTEEDLKDVYAPIGLDINAETPQEIAVSIIAQLIKVKNGDRAHE